MIHLLANFTYTNRKFAVVIGQCGAEKCRVIVNGPRKMYFYVSSKSPCIHSCSVITNNKQWSGHDSKCQFEHLVEIVTLIAFESLCYMYLYLITLQLFNTRHCDFFQSNVRNLRRYTGISNSIDFISNTYYRALGTYPYFNRPQRFRLQILY